MNNKQITITEASARRAMLRLSDWLEYPDDMTAETRADIIALDELIKALDAEDEHQKAIDERRANLQRLNAEYQERQKAEASE
jgi:hypothetical protein